MKIREKMFTERNLSLANNWLGKAEGYRQASLLAAGYGHSELHNFLRKRMRWWALSVAEEIKKHA
jgi:hypothetical protein